MQFHSCDSFGMSTGQFVEFLPWVIKFNINVQIIETVYPEHVNYYFYASDGELPFETDQVLTFKR